MKTKNSKWGIDRTTITITLLSTIIGAVIMFSKVLDAGFIDRALTRLTGMEEHLKWLIAVAGGLGIGAWVQRALYRKEVDRLAFERNRLQEELIKKGVDKVSVKE